MRIQAGLVWTCVALLATCGTGYGASSVGSFRVDFAWSTFPTPPPVTSLHLVIAVGPHYSGSNPSQDCRPPYGHGCVVIIDKIITPSDNGQSFTIDSTTNGNFQSIVEAFRFPSGFEFTNESPGVAGQSVVETDSPLRGEITSLTLTVDNFCSSPPGGCIYASDIHVDNAILMHLTVLALSSTLAIPHVGAGDTWSTGFLIFNTNTTPAQFVMAFYDDAGHQLALPFANGSTAIASATVPGLGSLYFETGDPGKPLATGWGLVDADPSLVVQSMLRNRADGTFYEAAIPATAGSKEFLIPFDATIFAGTSAPFYTGFAIANMEETASHVYCTARDSNGTVIPNAIPLPPSLAPLGHWSNYLFPLLTGKRGTIACQSTTRIAAVGFRFIGSSAFSSLPVTETLIQH